MRKVWGGGEAVLLIFSLSGACNFLAGAAMRMVGVCDMSSPPNGAGSAKLLAGW